MRSLSRLGAMLAVAIYVLLAPFASAAAADGATPHAKEIESYLSAYPKRALAELSLLRMSTDAVAPADRLYIESLHGQALVTAGRGAEAIELADRIEKRAADSGDPVTHAVALLIRSDAESQSGDFGKANALAKEARSLLDAQADPYYVYWAAITIGMTARAKGQLDEALSSLHEAQAAADIAQSPYRQSHALYQLANLYLDLKQPQNALDAAREAFLIAQRGGVVQVMVYARIVESGAMEQLNEPERELAAIEDALAIARSAKSAVAEGLVLINLADLKLRRKLYADALEHSRLSLALAREHDDAGSVATSKANMGFALFGLGRIAEGRRLADEALSNYERSGATAETASLLGEYSQYLERSGDYKSALSLNHRARKLHDQMAATAHQKSVLEIQTKYEVEKRSREIELLNRENDLNVAALENRALQQRIWWLLAAIFALSFLVVAVLYRKLRATNALLASRNQELNVRSSRDPLTSLYNRRYFQEYMRDGLEKTGRRRAGDEHNPVHALLLIDIDRFKDINDQHGHAGGDAVLIAVAQRLRDTLRETDIIVRWGGEEFLVFVPATSAEKLDEIAARIMDAIGRQPVDYHDRAIRVTASLGYAPIPLPPHDIALSWERAIHLIDMALYMAKLRGRNRAYGVRRLLRSDAEALAAIERDLEKAWEAGIVDMLMLRGPDLGPDSGPTTSGTVAQSGG